MLQKAGSDAIFRVADIKQTLQNSLHSQKCQCIGAKVEIITTIGASIRR